MARGMRACKAKSELWGKYMSCTTACWGWQS